MRPEPEPDRQARGCRCNARNRRERPVPPTKLDHRGARFATSALDDPPTQRLRWRRPFGRVGQGGDRLAEQSKLLSAFLAILEMPLEPLALFVVECVERVRRQEIVGFVAHLGFG